MRLGLVVNPLAGVGGPAALKGSDDRAAVERALAAGATAPAPARARAALAALAPDGVELLAGPGPLGADVARAAGHAPVEVGPRPAGATTAADTRAAAAALVGAGVDLLLFAGGDGTAVDVLQAVGDAVPVLGIPAGVKMHSAAFAVTPSRVAAIVAAVAAGRARARAAEVMDVDEAALARGVVAPRLHGTLRVPAVPGLVQGGKARSAPDDATAHAGIARTLAALLADGRPAALGPGTTTAAILAELGLPATLLGVDVVRDGALVAADADEATLAALAADGLRIVVAPTGGQGFLLGRGNQQLSARVVAAAGRDALVVVATERKLAALAGAPLLVDTGDPAVDALLAGHVRVVVGERRDAVYPVSS